jgi:5-aminolevulinate synthase
MGDLQLTKMDLHMTDYDKELARHLEELKRGGHYRHFLSIDKSAESFPHFHYLDEHGNKKTAVNWCSNDYLCMSVHAEVIDELNRMARLSGVGSGGTRNISGTTLQHRELENALAGLHEKEAALVFGSAYAANLTALSTLARLFTDVVFLSDEKNHASLIEGMKGGAAKRIFRHNDATHLEELLSQLPAQQPKIIVLESVYSISGTIAPLEQIVSLAKQYNCLVYLDEVHAVGLYGQAGGGLASELGVQDKIDIINGTLAKGFGVFGGYIAASKTIIDAVRSFGSGFIFTTSLPPALCAAAEKSIELVSRDPGLRETFHAKVAQLRDILGQHKIEYRANLSHITPVHIGDSALCKKISDRLLHDFGVYLQPINYPTVKKGEECLRMIATVRHSEGDMLHLAQSLQTVLGEELPSLQK